MTIALSCMLLYLRIHLLQIACFLVAAFLLSKVCLRPMLIPKNKSFYGVPEISLIVYGESMKS